MSDANVDRAPEQAPVDALVSVPASDGGDAIDDLVWLTPCVTEPKQDVAERFGLTEAALS